VSHTGQQVSIIQPGIKPVGGVGHLTRRLVGHGAQGVGEEMRVLQQLGGLLHVRVRKGKVTGELGVQAEAADAPDPVLVQNGIQGGGQFGIWAGSNDLYVSYYLHDLNTAINGIL
jgi:hypothetical protein